MKKFITIAFIVFAALALVAGAVTYAYWDGKTMSSAEVKAKWGDQKIDYKKFKDSSYELKSKMAYSVMTDKSLIGKSYEEIREIFGPNDGYFFTDTIPAYIVQRGKARSEDTWQLVFRMDKNYKLKEIFMHKNCCE